MFVTSDDPGGPVPSRTSPAATAADVLLDCVGADATIELARTAARPAR